MQTFTRGRRTGLALVALTVGLLLSTTTAGATSNHGAPDRAAVVTRPAVTDNWFTYHHDQNRQGYNALADHASGQLHTAWTATLDGAVYGEPLVVFGKIIAVTENDTIYALSLKGKVLWKAHVGTPVPLSELPCGNIDPLGITGTPIYSPKTHQLYFTAELDNPIRHRLFAVNAANGHVDWSRSVDPQGMVASATQERGALAIAQGRVWTPYGGLAGDCGPYHGWVVGSLLSGKGALSVYQQPSSREAGIWAPPGPAVDSAGHLYVAVGNGAALAPPYDDSDSIIELDGNKKLSLFAPSNWAEENANDLDLGSTGPMLFTALGQNWVFGDGKAGDGYLLHQRHLGGIGGYAATISGCKSWSGLAFHDGVIYVPCLDGLSAYRVVQGPALQKLWQNTAVLYGASPVVGGGAVWAVYGNRLFQLNPTTGQTVSSIDVGAVTPHFVTPTLRADMVFVGTVSGVTAIRTS